MKKKLGFFAVAFLFLMPGAFAQEISVSNDNELIDAFKNSKTGDTIKLTSDILDHKGGSSSLRVNGGKNITLDLNGHNIATPDKSDRSIVVYGGELTITGPGTITHKTHNALNVWGSETKTDGIFSKLTVSKDVTLEGYNGLSIFEDEKNGAYGTQVDFAGKINAYDIGISTSGFILNENGPVVNIKKSAVISSTKSDGVGVYLAGNGTCNIENGAEVTAAQPIEIRAGNINVYGGTFTSSVKILSSTPNGSGATTKGAGISVVQHTTKLPISVNIKGGTFKGAEAVYVNNTQGNSEADFAKVKVQITGGTFSTNVFKYTANNCTVNKVNGMYEVVLNKVLEDDKGTFESDKPLDNKYTLVIKEKTKEETASFEKEISKSIKAKNIDVISVYDLNVTDGTNIIPMENGNFTISLALDKSKQIYDTYKVVYIDENGVVKETLPAKLVNGNIVFTTSHLSTYAVVGYSAASAATIKNPETSDINLPLILVIGLISLGGIALTSKKLLEK